MKELFLIGIIIGIVVIVTLPLVESAIPPTRAYDRITTSNGTIFGFNSSANLNAVGTGLATVTGSNNSKTMYINVAGGATTFESLTNVTDSFCTTNQVRKAVSNQWVCADDVGVGAAITSINADTTAAQVFSGTAGNITITDTGAGTLQFNTGSNVIVKASKVGDLSDVALGCTNGQILQYQSSNSTFICVTLAGGGTPRTNIDLKATWTDSNANLNIGTAFINIYEQTNSDGKSIYINSTGYTHVRLQVLWNKVGTGTQTVQVSNGGANVLISMNVVSGSNDSGWVAIPACCDETELLYRLQGKSTTAADDPIFEAAHVWMKGTDSS